MVVKIGLVVAKVEVVVVEVGLVVVDIEWMLQGNRCGYLR